MMLGACPPACLGCLPACLGSLHVPAQAKFRTCIFAGLPACCGCLIRHCPAPLSAITAPASRRDLQAATTGPAPTCWPSWCWMRCC